jgi:hypothetical protein
MGKKRKLEYIDRSVHLKKFSSNGFNSSSGEELLLGKLSSSFGSYERRFEYKIYVDNLSYLEAFVMANGVCVMFFPLMVCDVSESVNFIVNTDGISGKRKKGAQRVKGGSIICSLTCISGEVMNFKSPVGGQLLEINTLLQSPQGIALLNGMPCGERYVCVLLPDEELPTPDAISSTGTKHESNMLNKDSVCFAWIKGNCKRGDTCKFDHFVCKKDVEV